MRAGRETNWQMIFLSFEASSMRFKLFGLPVVGIIIISNVVTRIDIFIDYIHIIYILLNHPGGIICDYATVNNENFVFVTV